MLFRSPRKVTKPGNITRSSNELLGALARASISERASLASSQAGQRLLAALTPTELASIFPDYYKRSDPDVSGFIKATSRRYAGIPAGQEYSVTAKAYKGPGIKGVWDPGLTRQKKQQYEKSLENSAVDKIQRELGLKIDPSAKAKLSAQQEEIISKLQKQNISVNDQSVAFLKNIDAETLKKAGIERIDGEYKHIPLTEAQIQEGVEKGRKYRPEYKLSDVDLSDPVVNTIAGEAYTKNRESVDAVINNMLNRVGTKGWGPSSNLREVARAPGQYEGFRPAKKEEADFIRERIREIASGNVPDNTKGSNEFRATSYVKGAGAGKSFARRAEQGGIGDVGGNTFAYNPSVKPGPYSPYSQTEGRDRPLTRDEVIQREGQKRTTVLLEEQLKLPPSYASPIVKKYWPELSLDARAQLSNMPPDQLQGNRATETLSQISPDKLASLSPQPGGSMLRQGVETALGNMHPEYLSRAAKAQAELQAAGFKDAGISSAHRPAAMGINPGFSYKSLHRLGLAGDWSGLPKLNDPGYPVAADILKRNGFYNPYPNNNAEYNHWQIIPEKTLPEDHPIWKHVSPQGPINKEEMWKASGIPIPASSIAQQEERQKIEQDLNKGAADISTGPFKTITDLQKKEPTPSESRTEDTATPVEASKPVQSASAEPAAEVKAYGGSIPGSQHTENIKAFPIKTDLKAGKENIALVDMSKDKAKMLAAVNSDEKLTYQDDKIHVKSKVNPQELEPQKKDYQPTQGNQGQEPMAMGPQSQSQSNIMDQSHMEDIKSGKINPSTGHYTTSAMERHYNITRNFRDLTDGHFDSAASNHT